MAELELTKPASFRGLISTESYGTIRGIYLILQFSLSTRRNIYVASRSALVGEGSMQCKMM